MRCMVLVLVCSTATAGLQPCSDRRPASANGQQTPGPQTFGIDLGGGPLRILGVASASWCGQLSSTMDTWLAGLPTALEEACHHLVGMACDMQ